MKANCKTTARPASRDHGTLEDDKCFAINTAMIQGQGSLFFSGSMRDQPTPADAARGQHLLNSRFGQHIKWETAATK